MTLDESELPEDRSLLLVDDDSVWLGRLAKAMEQRGFQVIVAGSVAEGKSLARQHAPAFAVLDQRLLKELPDQEGSIKLSTSLNLNVSTLLSEQFLAFDRQLRNRTKKAMVIELQTIDVFGDVGAYQFARDFVRERGYKVCLDGLNYLTFPLLARSALDVDFQKIIWPPDLVEEDGSDRRDAFVQAVKQTEATRVILCRCDSMDAVRYGQALGITLFQGRLIDRLAKSGDIV